MTNKNIKEIKEKIIDSLEGIKEFDVSYWDEVCYAKKVKAKSKEELEEKFNGGELEFGEGDIIEENMIENSLEIEEVE